MVTFEDRKYHESDAQDLNQILFEAMKILESNDLGKSILTGAHYKGVVSQEEYEESAQKMRSRQKGFAVEEVYIGYFDENKGSATGGRCIMAVADDHENDPYKARGEIYIANKYVRDLIKAIGKEDATQYLANILAHEFTHANQATHAMHEISDSSSRLETDEKMHRKGGYFLEKGVTGGWESSLLTEANSDTAGLMMLIQTGEKSEKLANYYQDDIKKHGWISDEASGKLKDVLTGKEKASAEDVFRFYMQEKMNYVGTRSCTPLDFSSKEGWVRACYQEHLFGKNEEEFVHSTMDFLEKTTKEYMAQMKENLQNSEWLNAIHPRPKGEENNPNYQDKTNAEFLWRNFTQEVQGKDKNKGPTFEEIAAKKDEYFRSFGISDEAFVCTDVFQKAQKQHDAEILKQLSGRKQKFESPAVRRVSSEMSEILKNSLYVERG